MSDRKLSIVILTLNEENRLPDLLRSLPPHDELIVLDANSSDSTRDIAAKMGAKVYLYTDWQGFGVQKNRALSLATGDWVLSLDADERLTPELSMEIVNAMDTGAYVAYEFPRLTQFCGKWIRHCGWTPDRVTRLFKRGCAAFTNDRVHERLVVQAGGKTGRLSGHLLHMSYPTPQHLWVKLNTYSVEWARQRYEAGVNVSIFRPYSSALFAFFKSYFVRMGFLDGGMGLVVCTMQSQAAYAKYMHLYLLNQMGQHVD
jgi:glycosyltransferase involved in cell wall biosynthesis